MAISEVAFEPCHVLLIQPQPEQESSARLVSDCASSIAASGVGRTILSAGVPVACAGVVELWPGRWQAWAYVDAEIGHEGMAFLAFGARKFLGNMPDGTRRVEISVLRSFTNGHRLAKILGFVAEGVMRRYDLNGDDHVLYARIY